MPTWIFPHSVAPWITMIDSSVARFLVPLTSDLTIGFVPANCRDQLFKFDPVQPNRASAVGTGRMDLTRIRFLKQLLDVSCADVAANKDPGTASNGIRLHHQQSEIVETLLGGKWTSASENPVDSSISQVNP